MTPGGEVVPLRAVANIQHRRSLNEVWRENQQPVINVTAEIEDRDLGSVTGDIQQKLNGFAVPPGYRLELAGNYRNQQEAFWNLMLVLLVAVSLVFLLMAIQFGSVVLPLLNFLTLPLSLTSALAALWITGTPLNVSSLMGAILLIGLDVKNGILLIGRVGQLRDAGTPLEESLIQAGRERFRPIVMTSLTTILGLLPLALGLGPGAQMQQPLAIAVIGGLLANMLFTRLVIPVGYVVLARTED
jgi:multidrug efflux pump subunit AcrB